MKNSKEYIEMAQKSEMVKKRRYRCIMIGKKTYVDGIEVIELDDERVENQIGLRTKRANPN